MDDILSKTQIKQNQLFKRVIPKSVIKSVIEAFGLTNLNDIRWFSKTTMRTTKTVEKIHELTKILMDYYLPCKARNYLHIITDKICITILRQLLREYDYKLISKETYRNKKKQILYCIKPEDEVVLVKYVRSNSPLNNTVVNKTQIHTNIKIDNNPDYVISFQDKDDE